MCLYKTYIDPKEGAPVTRPKVFNDFTKRKLMTPPAQNMYTPYNFFKLIFFSTKDGKILLFLMEHYTIKTDIVRYYLFFITKK